MAHLAMIDLSDDELETFTHQLDDVLNLAEELGRFNVDGVEPTAHPFGLVNVFRDDVPLAEAEAEQLRTDALAAGPDVEDHQFRVPPALGEAP